MAKANGLDGLYIVFDGIVGCGKSEQIRQLKQYLPLDFPQGNFVFTYEPGGNPEADVLRQKVKFEKMSPFDEMNTFAESRSITIPQVIIPALGGGGVVLSDRAFTTSLTYQAFGRDLGMETVWNANKNAVGKIFPDLLVYIKVGLEASLKRSAGENPDKFDGEARDFWNKVILGYDHMISFLKEISPETKVIQIDDPEGVMSIEETRLSIKSELYPILKDHFHEGRILRDRQM